MDTSRSCPKCQNKMAVGFVNMKSPGRIVARTFEVIGTWIEGAPERGLFGVDLRGKKSIEVATYRCAGCGYLESYAP